MTTITQKTFLDPGLQRWVIITITIVKKKTFGYVRLSRVDGSYVVSDLPITFKQQKTAKGHTQKRQLHSKTIASDVPVKTKTAD